MCEYNAGWWARKLTASSGSITASRGLRPYEITALAAIASDRNAIST